MRQNGNGALTLEDARTWIEETGLCLFLPKRQFATSIAPSFVEAVAGKRDATPDPKHIAVAEELLVRLELDGVAVRLNLLGLPGEQPDFVVAGWVLPYVYALRGDRDWRRSPQLTGSRQVSPLAVQAYKLLEAADTNISDLTHTLGREVTEVAVLRAITELWQQLRIIPVISAPGQPARWQLLRTRFQKAIAEGASTSQVTAISVLASIYLQAVIAATMEEVEVFLASLTARSKVREVLRGLVATRQVHSLSLGHAPHFYVAGTLPEFAVAPTLYASSSMPAYFLRDQEDDLPEPEVLPAIAAEAESVAVAKAAPATPHSKPAETHAPRTVAHKPAAAPRSHSAAHPTSHSRDRKPAPSSSGARSASAPRWTPNAPANGKRPHSASSSANGARPTGKLSTNGSRPASSTSGARPANGARPVSGARTTKSAAPAWNQRSSSAPRSGTGKPAAKSGAPARPSSSSRPASRPSGPSRPASSARPAARPSSGGSRKPAPTTAKSGSSAKHFGYSARPAAHGSKKRG